MKFGEFKREIDAYLNSQDYDEDDMERWPEYAKTMFTAFQGLPDDAEVGYEYVHDKDSVFAKEYNYFKRQVILSSDNNYSSIFEELDKALVLSPEQKLKAQQTQAQQAQAQQAQKTPSSPMTDELFSAHDEIANCMLNSGLLQGLIQFEDISSSRKMEVRLHGMTAEGRFDASGVVKPYAISKPLASAFAKMDASLSELALHGDADAGAHDSIEERSLKKIYTDLGSWLQTDAINLFKEKYKFEDPSDAGIAREILELHLDQSSYKLCAQMYLMLDPIFNGKGDVETNKRDFDGECVEFTALIGSIEKEQKHEAAKRQGLSSSTVINNMMKKIPPAPQRSSAPVSPEKAPSSNNDYDAIFEALKKHFVNQNFVDSLERKHRPAGKSVQIGDGKSKRISDTLADIIELLQNGKQNTSEDKQALMKTIHEKVSVWLKDRAPELIGKKAKSNPSEVSIRLIRQVYDPSSTTMPKKEHYSYAVIYDSLDKVFGSEKAEPRVLNKLPDSLDGLLTQFDSLSSKENEEHLEEDAGPSFQPRH